LIIKKHRTTILKTIDKSIRPYKAQSIIFGTEAKEEKVEERRT